MKENSLYSKNLNSKISVCRSKTYIRKSFQVAAVLWIRTLSELKVATDPDLLVPSILFPIRPKTL
jgi:hypothetical protein